MAAPKRVVELPLENGGAAFVELDSEVFDDDDGGGYSGYPSRLSSQTTEKSPRSFASAIKTIKPIAGSIIEEFRDLPEVPDEVSVEFGIKMSATSGLVITSSESVSNFRITLKWKTSK